MNYLTKQDIQEISGAKRLIDDDPVKLADIVACVV